MASNGVEVQTTYIDAFANQVDQKKLESHTVICLKPLRNWTVGSR
jgi:hypothetical protein